MKTILLALLLSSSFAQAGVLNGLPAANLMRALMALNVPQIRLENRILISAESLECDHDTGYNTSPEDIIWGLGRRSCSLNDKDLSTADSEMLMDAMAGACLPADAGLGHWSMSVTSLVCTVELKELVNEKRFVCSYMEDQPDPRTCSNLNTN